jgi:hypothetical protein
MAKKRKEKTDEEEIDFKLPKFDEEKFLKKERRNIKTLFLSALIGLIIALISFSFWTLLSGSELRWELVLLIGVFNASWLKYLFTRLNIDLTDFGKKGWFGSYAIYFFTWLIVLIILVNPPFYDDEAPYVDLVVLPDIQELSGTVQILAHINDNVGVEKQDIDLTLLDPDGKQISADFTFDNNIFSYTHESPDNLTGDNTYTFKLTAKDVNGKITEKEGSFKYSTNAIKLAEPVGATTSPGPSVTYSSDIKFDVGTNVSRFYYKVDNRDEINVTKGDNFYETSPKYEGWIKNKNVTVHAYADVIYYFENNPTQFNNTIVDYDPYYFNVSNAIEIGGEQPPEIELPGPRYVGATPGFEVAIFLISLCIVALIFKYRKKDKKK